MTPNINNPIWLETLTETSARAQTVAQHTQDAHLMLWCGVIVAFIIALVLLASWWEQDAKYKRAHDADLQRETQTHAAQWERAA
jgi:hypothetical protein